MKPQTLPSLYTRIAFVFGIAMIVISASTMYISRTTQFSHWENLATQQYSKVASVLQTSSIDAIIAEDISLLSNLVQEIGTGDPNIALLEITNDQQQLLAKWETPRANQSDLLRIEPTPIVIQGKVQGQVLLVVDMSYQHQQINHFIVRNSLIVFVLLLLLFVVQLILLRREAIQPIQAIEHKLTEIENGHPSPSVVGHSKEIVQLSYALNRVAQTLQQRQLAQNEARAQLESLNRAYVRFVPAEFLRQLGKANITKVELGDYQCTNITILFSDIRNFTTMAENMSASDTFMFLNQYLAKLGPVVREHNGFIDKYIGDAIMAIFTSTDDAVNAGLAMLRALDEFNAEYADNAIRIGVGLHTGEVMLGTIGETFRMEGTVIGDTVNLAARLETLTKTYDTPFLISETVKDTLSNPETYTIHFVDEVLAKGKSIPTKIYSVS